MAMAKFGKEWAPKLGKNAYNTVMEFNVEEVKNNIQLIRERGNLKQLAADLSGKSFEVGTAFLMQKLGRISSKLAKNMLVSWPILSANNCKEN
uniref:Uncharacterized protein n=1 Tax=Ditylenchus dipsaci TaxID=166011 RepID=A0A915DWW3_9BILA